MAASKRREQAVNSNGKQPRPRKYRRLLTSFYSTHANMSYFPPSDQIDRSQKPIPIKPTSQKAATMPPEPDDEKIKSLMEFTQMPRSQAIRYLKAKSNDLDAAALAYFEGEDISKSEEATHWDESLWAAGKDGVEYGNSHLRPIASSAAATRPNSPALSNSGRANLHPTSKQQEDDDLAAAMAMSQGNLPVAYQQESGRVGADGQSVQFGPANRESYEKGQWEMVPIGVHNTSEIVPDTDVEQRVHTPGEPRLLKHLPSGDYTPNFLTICHAIDGAREAMLLRNYAPLSYGQDAEWWRGHNISLPRIVNVEDGSSAAPDSDWHDELLAEVQRLMAFLEASQRSYASVGALTQNDAFNSGTLNATPSRTLLETFLQQWANAASTKLDSDSTIHRLFSTTVGTTAAEGSQLPSMSLVDMQVDIPQDSKSDLFEQLDDLLWDTKGTDTAMSENYIERPAEVLVMRAYQQNASANPQLRLEIPAEFYVDKYLPENIEATRATRAKMSEGRKRIAKIEEIEKKLTHWAHPAKHTTIETSALLRHTIGHFSGSNRKEILNADKSSNLDAEDMAAEQPHYQEIAQKLEKVIASIDDKLLTLTEEKERTRKAIADISKAPPAGLNQEDLKHRYTLRGVATKPNITYVLRPIDPATAETSADEMLDDDTTPQGMRWWRMDYEVTATGARITKSKSADYDVLRAVELEHSSALLVYASDHISSYSTPPQPLSQPLQDFIDKDNNLFANELQLERTRPPAYDFSNDIDRNSLDSTRANDGGGSDFGVGEEEIRPLLEEDDFFSGTVGIKQGYRFEQHELGGQEMDEDAPVHEIKLDTPEEVDDEGIEMVEVEDSQPGEARGKL